MLPAFTELSSVAFRVQIVWFYLVLLFLFKENKQLLESRSHMRSIFLLWIKQIKPDVGKSAYVDNYKNNDKLAVVMLWSIRRVVVLATSRVVPNHSAKVN